MSSPKMSPDRGCFVPTESTRFGLFSTYPAAIRAYLLHTEFGLGLRGIARHHDCQPSTVLRQVRKIEERREDRLLDAALSWAVEQNPTTPCFTSNSKECAPMYAAATVTQEKFETKVSREARRILRRLCEKDAFLAVAEDMEKAVVLRESVAGRPTRTAVVDRDVAYEFALKDWISCASSARISRYEITDMGRSALKRILEEERQSRAGQQQFAESPSPFRTQHQEYGERRVMGSHGQGETRVRYNLAESPLTVLGRKRDRSGTPFLQPHLIDAGERLREDFEMAQLGPRIAQNWDNFLIPRESCGGVPTGDGPSDASSNARARFHDAMAALGPGLSDVAFRVCCFLEGLETAEKRLGWSARSGKVVLRIALQRLAIHYGLAPAPSADGIPGGAAQRAEQTTA